MKPLLKFGEDEEKQPLVINTSTELILTVMQVIVQTGVGKNWHVILKSAVHSHYSHHGVQNPFFLIFNGAFFSLSLGACFIFRRHDFLIASCQTDVGTEGEKTGSSSYPVLFCSWSYQRDLIISQRHR